MAADDKRQPRGVHQPAPGNIHLPPQVAERQRVERRDAAGHRGAPAVVQHMVGMGDLPHGGRGLRALRLQQREREAAAAPTDETGKADGRVQAQLLYQRHPRVPHSARHNTGSGRQAGRPQRPTALEGGAANGPPGHKTVAEAGKPAHGIPQGKHRQHAA